MRVKAAVARTHGRPLEIEKLDLVDPGPDEIVVRLVACGVGMADHHAIIGILPMPLPFVPGTEGAGIVEHVGRDVRDLQAGDSVFIDYGACGRCGSCLMDHPRACTEFVETNLSGRRHGQAPFNGAVGAVNGYFFGQSSFATHAVCRADQVIKLPSDTPLEIAAALGGEVLTAVAAVTDVFRPRRHDVLAITGAGLAGLVACLVAREWGIGTIVIADADESRRHLASTCGATVAVHSDADLTTAIRSLDADGASFALDTTGSQSALDACRAGLGPGGVLATTWSGWRRDDESTVGDRPPVLVDRQVSPRRLIPQLVDLYTDGRFPIDRLIRFFPLAHVNAALAALEDATSLKPVLRYPLGAFDDLDRAKSEGAVDERPDENPDDDPATNGPREPAETVKS